MSNIVPIDKDNMSVAEINKIQEDNINDALVNIMKVPPALLSTANTLAKQYRIKHGLNASIPMLCKAAECPFWSVCQVPINERMVDERCLQEIAAMVSRFESLCGELNIQPDDHVDMGLVKDVVDIEIMLIRADNRLAIDGDMIKDYFATVDQNGRRHTKEEVNVVVQTKLSLMEKKMKLLEKLNSTRKDKAEEMKKKKDLSVKSASLVAKARLMTNNLKNAKIEVEEEQEINVEINEVEFSINEDSDMIINQPFNDEEDDII